MIGIEHRFPTRPLWKQVGVLCQYQAQRRLEMLLWEHGKLAGDVGFFLGGEGGACCGGPAFGVSDFGHEGLEALEEELSLSFELHEDLGLWCGGGGDATGVVGMTRGW